MTTEASDTNLISDADRVKELEARIRSARTTLTWADDLWRTFNDLAGENHTPQEAQGMLMILQGIMQRADAALADAKPNDA